MVQDGLHHARSDFTVLVVEDEDEAARTVGRFLTLEGWRHLHARSAEEAMAILGDRRDIIAVLLDIMMPTASGYEVLRYVREHNGLRDLPVIVVSALNAVKDRLQGLTNGADDYVSKPYDGEELMARLECAIQRRLLRDHLRQRLEDLEQERDELGRMSKIKDKFISAASHDLRSPLTNIKGYAELMLHRMLGDLTTEQEDALQIIVRNTNHLLDLLLKLLDVSRIESGEFFLAPESLNLGPMLESIRGSYLLRAKEKKIDLRPPTVAETLPRIEGDRGRLTSVIENLIDNALKFCREGDVIETVLEPAEGGVRFTIKDTGPGIPPDEQNGLFHRFTKLSSRPTGGEKSVGLGLWLVKSIVELHGGAIKAESDGASGTTFTLWLPPAPPAETPSTKNATQDN